jgi:hypothetical protein
VNSSFSRRGLLWLMVALATAAVAVPTAEARHAPGEDPATTSPLHSLAPGSPEGRAPTSWKASALEIDRLGPKHVALQHPLAPAPVSITKVVGPGGFNWGDAAIGASVAGFALALVGGLAVLISQRSRRPDPQWP